jgi:hypothetical protein
MKPEDINEAESANGTAACAVSRAVPCSQASFDEVWERLRPFMGSDYDTQNAIIVMDHFGWIDNGPCTCGLEIYGDPCPHHSRPENDAGHATQTAK